MRTSIVAALIASVTCATVGLAQPANDDCADSTVIASLPFSDLGVDMTTATTEAGDPVSDCFGGQGTNSVWYLLPAGAVEALHRGETGGTGSDYGVRVFTGSCGALTEIWCDSTEPAYPEFAVAAEGQEVLVEVVNLGTAGTLDLSLDETDEFLIHKDGSRTTTVAGGPGGFLVMWESPPAQARLYDPDGNPIGASFSIAPGYLIDPNAAAAGDGSFFVVWDGPSPQAARIDGPGQVVSLPMVSAGSYPKVAADADGDFVIVWGGVSAQRFDRDGTPQGGVFQVNTYTTGFQGYPAVAMAPSGDFVVTWEGTDDGAGDGIGARLYDATGAPTTGEFVVNSYTTYNQFFPAATMDAAGNFVIAWRGGYYYGPPTFEDTIKMRRFDASGTALAPDFIVNTEEYYNSGHLEVEASAAGEFMVSWETYGTYRDNFVDNAFRRFDADGTPQGPQFLAGDFGGYGHYDPSVGATPDGSFMVVWNDFRGFFTTAPTGSNVEDAIVALAFPVPNAECTHAALTTCRQPTLPLKSKMLLKDEVDDIKDQLRWKFVKGAATDAADFGDPTTSEDYVLCMYDASSATGALLFQAQAPAGGTCGTKPCWKAVGNPPGAKGYRYKDKDRTPNGILKMVLKPGIEGKSKIVIKGGQNNVFTGAAGAPPLPLPLPVTMQLQNTSGKCWEATYDTDGVGVNEVGFFKGSGS